MSKDIALPKLELIDLYGNKLFQSTGKEIEQSVLVDPYGSRITTGDLMINGVVVTKHPNYNYFYRLNDVHDSFKGNVAVLEGRHWNALGPNQWYRPSRPAKRLTRLFDTVHNLLQLETADMDVETMRYPVSNTGLPNGRPVVEYADYPILVIDGGSTVQGTYCPIIGLLEYCTWVTPSLHIDVLNTYINSTVLDKRLGQAFYNIDADIVKNKLTNESFASPSGTMNWSEYANYLRLHTGRDIGRNRMLQILRKNGWLHDGTLGENNTVTLMGDATGFFEKRDYVLQCGKLNKQTYITEFGARTLANFILQEYLAEFSK